jgi:phosphoglucosamine mutase
MGKLFGTDGIRGVVNQTLDVKLAFRIGQAAAIAFGETGEEKPLFVMGQDTRISSDLLAGALTAGLCTCGANVMNLGVIPTPAVAYLTVQNRACAGVVISASHNPYEHNGIKLFSGAGFKLSDELEARIEELILSEGELPAKTHGDVGCCVSGAGQKERYLDHLASTAPDGISGLHVLFDCANGAASNTARALFSRFGIDADFIHNKPNGVNINDGCGSTHLEDLSKTVVSGGYDIGIAFDGDADRCLAVDELGREIDGDKIMAICATAMHDSGDLVGDGFVATIMSNIGLHKFAQEHHLHVLCAQVGDRNVLEMMQKEGMVLGGEQSGHIIFLDHMTTGDGQLAAIQLLRILAWRGCKASELSDAVPRYPQELINVTWRGAASEKKTVTQIPAVAEAIAAGEKQLAGDGRILVRPSGTEALIRVMVEASDAELAKTVAKALAETIENVQIS